MSPKVLVIVILCAQPPHSMTSFAKRPYPTTVIGARYPNAVNYDCCMIYTLLQQSDRCEVCTLMQQSDWCKQHTTLHANIELSFF